MTATRPDEQADATPTFHDRVKRILPYALILAAGLYFLHVTRGFEYDQTAGSLGPDAWPRLVLLLMTAACSFEILRLVLFWKGDRRSQAIEDDIAPDLVEGEPGFNNLAQSAAALGAIVIYLLALPYLGFFTATAVFIWVFALVAGYRRLIVMTAVTLSLALAFMFLFMRVIYVSLPIGVEPFARISIWIMKLLGVA